MIKISDKEIELKGSVLYQTSPWFRSVVAELLAAQEEISKFKDSNDVFRKMTHSMSSEISKLREANTAMREDMQRIVERAELALDETDSYGFKVGLTAVRQLARQHIADIEKGAEGK